MNKQLSIKHKSIRENPFIDDAIHDFETVLTVILNNSSKEEYSKFLLIHGIMFMEMYEEYNLKERWKNENRT